MQQCIVKLELVNQGRSGSRKEVKMLIKSKVLQISYKTNFEISPLMVTTDRT